MECSERELGNRVASFVLMLVLMCGSAHGQAQGREQTATLTKQFTQTIRMQYIVVFPKGYTTGGGPWPVILYLHGAGDRGADLALVRRTAAVKQAEIRKDYPFVLVAPQEPDVDQAWVQPQNMAAVMAILDDVLRKYHGDPDRVYMTGAGLRQSLRCAALLMFGGRPRSCTRRPGRFTEQTTRWHPSSIPNVWLRSCRSWAATRNLPR